MKEKSIYTKKEQEILQIMDLHSPQEIIGHYPFRYETVRPLAYEEWIKDEKVTFEGKLLKVGALQRFRGITKSTFDVLLSNEEVIHCTIFNRPWISKLKSGTLITVFGKYDGNQRVTASNYNNKPLSEQSGIFPVYNLKEGVTMKYVRSIMEKTLNNNTFENLIPQEYINQYRLYDRNTALREIHFPTNANTLNNARRTLKYEEFLRFSCIMQSRKSELSNKDAHYAKDFDFDEVFALANRLKFNLTKDQLKAVNEILEDLKEPKAMMRLVQGDVGCGKTIVAILGLYANSLSYHQGAFMVPTEILAQQQYEELKEVLRPTNLKIRALYSALSAAEKKEVLEGLKNGEIDIVVGTHSLIQEGVIFQNLGMIVTDEQHRFGVNQRKKLLEKGQYVDVLVMSATPIPRTLQGVMFGDMDISVIETLPPGRKPVKTKLVAENSLRTVLPEILPMLDAKDRAYVIAPAIEDDNESLQNVTKLYNSLSSYFAGRFEVGFLHGKLSSEEKAEVMQEFKDGRIQILVSTTVVEVGVNVKEANIMIIYNADRFGLSQIHQLRGRIKRGSKQGYCYLLTEKEDPETLERLKILEEHENGFEVAEYDLKLRGPGDILGVRQSGMPIFQIIDVTTDQNVIRTAIKDAEVILKKPKLLTEAMKKEIEKYLKTEVES
ncbi:MAG: ATP-dependent DNA helicase RecG [Erysipelotrichaceae bacterium]|nr:ATP-dependent DNA helicase RecG [Erysipelotrichaceae bacterium]